MQAGVDAYGQEELEDLRTTERSRNRVVDEQVGTETLASNRRNTDPDLFLEGDGSS